jgi:hypothetical protein
MLRHCLVSHGPRLVMAPMVAVGGADEAFEGNALKGEMEHKLLADQMAALRALAG